MWLGANEFGRLVRRWSAHHPDLGLVGEFGAEEVTRPVRLEAVPRVEAAGPVVDLENP